MLETLTLDDPAAQDASVVGSKAAGLAALRVAGFEVPDAVVLPVGVAAGWRNGGAEEIRSSVEGACATLGDRLAVRSSATWEDGEASARAGATVTVLDVGGVDETLDAVRRCVEGTEQARRELGLGGDLAVIIQRLVPAEWAGVAFTADPVTGESDVVRIAAAEGLGEALVQGEVIGSDVTLRGGAIDGDLGSLPAEWALAIAEAARRVEADRGRPQDIEWAVAGGVLHLLQTRPITVLPVEPDYPEGNNWQKDTAHYPEPLTPFGFSLLEAGSDVVRGVFDEAGTLIRGLEERFVGGEIYGRVLPAMGSPDDAGRPPPALVMGLAARIVPELRRRTKAARRLLDDGVLDRWVAEWHRTDRDEMIRRVADLDGVELSALGDDGLGEHGDRCLALARRGLQIHFRLMIAQVHSMHALHRLVVDELGWSDADVARMFAGHSPATRAAEEAMADLRRRVEATAGGREALEANRGDPVGALEAVDPALAADLASWIRDHGWSPVNYDAGVRTLAERPTVVTQIVLSAPTPADHAGAIETSERARAAFPEGRRDVFDAALDRARDQYPLREDNTVIADDRPFALLRRWMLEVGRRLADRGVIPDAEGAAYLRVGELREALEGRDLAELGDRIARRQGEEAWVRANPGPSHLGEQGPPPDISRLPDPLRRVNEPILWMVSHEYPPPVDAPDDDAVLVAGIPASAGVVEGPVRLIRSHAELDRLADGDVLVCQVTSPSWAPLFPLAAAVVADGGGALSHAAIASREHAIPAVLGAGNATSTLEDGQRVRVDGTRGVVLAVD